MGTVGEVGDDGMDAGAALAEEPVQSLRAEMGQVAGDQQPAGVWGPADGGAQAAQGAGAGLGGIRQAGQCGQGVGDRAWAQYNAVLAVGPGGVDEVFQPAAAGDVHQVLGVAHAAAVAADEDAGVAGGAGHGFCQAGVDHGQGGAVAVCVPVQAGLKVVDISRWAGAIWATEPELARQGGAFVALDQDQVDGGRKLCDARGKARGQGQGISVVMAAQEGLRGVLNQNLSAGLEQPVGVRAGVVYAQAVAILFDHRHLQAPGAQFWH